MFNGDLQASSLSRGDLIGLRAMDVLSEDPHLLPARSLNSKEVRGAFCSARIGQPKCIRADDGSEWKNEVAGTLLTGFAGTLLTANLGLEG